MEHVTKKDKAIELMRQLGIYQPYIQDFQENDYVCFFERLAGFWDFQRPDLEAKRKKIEKKYNCLVYAITHEYLGGDELYSFLIVTDYPEEWDNLLQDIGHHEYYATAYVWNKSCEWCSEFGDITVQSAFGGIRRIA